MDFATVSHTELDATNLDDMTFGAIRMNHDGVVVHYNTAESKISGLSKERVEGRTFFEEVGVCMHNFMVGHKYEDEDHLDEFVDYILTVRMDPTPVTLRLLKHAESPYRYLLVLPK